MCPWKPEVNMESTHGQPQVLLTLDFETGYVTELVGHSFFQNGSLFNSEDAPVSVPLPQRMQMGTTVFRFNKADGDVTQGFVFKL